MSDDDRPKLSWRERDARKDHSYHRKEQPAPQQRKAKGTDFESRRYRSELEKAFGGGGLPSQLAEKVAERLPEGAVSKERLRLVKAIRNADSPTTALTLIAELYEVEHGLPPFEDVLVPAVEHERPEIALAGIEGLARLREHGPLKRLALLKMKLKGLEGVAPSPEVEERARELLDVLS